MQVFDEITRRWVNSRNCVRIIIQQLPEQIIFGYTSKPDRVVKVLITNSKGNVNYFETDLNLYKGELLYSKRRGVYFSPIHCNEDFILTEQLVKGFGDFPYILTRRYEAVENFDAFNGKQEIKDHETLYPLAKYLKYTFGLEFETSQGYVPEDICYRDGLIPLRDGSITGPEYSTVVLKGGEGLSLLHQQVETLKEYTNFNKECSLHVHLGGYPLKPDTIYNLYLVCRSIEAELEGILPYLTFKSSKYKDNGKDYCKKLAWYNSFEEMYLHLVRRQFFGSFTQAHPDDKERKRKWNIPTRYYWCNFINALCYQVNKTIEFRFLRPTYNFKKILLWLYIFNGILRFAEEYYIPENPVDLTIIMNTCYPPDLAKELCLGIKKLWALSVNQSNNGDHIGAEVWMEEGLFNSLKI